MKEFAADSRQSVLGNFHQAIPFYLARHVPRYMLCPDSLQSQL